MNDENQMVRQTLEQAVTLQQSGLFQEAGERYLSILQAQPDHPEANHNLGVLAVQMKQPTAALPYFMAALDADPARGQFWLSYIDAQFQAGQPDAAREMLALARQQGLQGEEVEALALRLSTDRQSLAQSAAEAPSPQETNTLATLYNEGRYAAATDLALSMTARFPRHGFGWMGLGMALNQMGRSADALAPLQKALELSPNEATAHCNLGEALHDLGRMDEAEASYRRALQIDPDNLEALNNLGNLFKDMKRLDEAEACFREATRINPELADAHYNLGNTLKELGRMDEAEASYRKAIQIRPDFAEAHYNLGMTFAHSELLEEAQASYRRAIQIKPDYADAHGNLGAALHRLGRLDESAASYRRAVQAAPNCAEAYNNLGNCLRDLGQLDDAAASYRRALQIDPGHAMAHSNLIFTLDLVVGADLPSIQEERKKWAAIHELPLLQSPHHSNDPDPERRLRIGYVSADFRSYSAPSIFGTMLFNFDRKLFDVFAYSNDTSPTEITHLFQKNVTGWRDIRNQSDDAVADLIRQDRIDILVDLSGHSRANRLPVFARKPAPIQITAWGYSTGTGMRSMDVLFSDPILIPPNEKHLYAEQVRYLPSFLSYSPCQAYPAVNALPALSTKTITFCMFNRLEKVSEEAYRIWAKILLSIPDSSLIFKNREMAHAEARKRVTDRFARAGVSPERLTLLGGSSWVEHMAAFNQADIALDPFPQGGGVTSLEGFLMGVPVITLHLPSFAGRTGTSFLTTLGLTDWIAETTEQYVEIAIRKAQDIASLAELRQQLRGIFTSSAIGDPTAYTRLVEQEYRQLWKEWCSRVKSS